MPFTNKPNGRAKPFTVSCRLSKKDKAAFDKARGKESSQDVLEGLILDFVNGGSE